ncbi:MAG: glycine betaine ABC transporter substrate-binding protein [Chloroflexaceae bacterium]|nr:glycine betaine ABC transporter substrate-binding protein [Chloroflexaceae bacterium]
MTRSDGPGVRLIARLMVLMMMMMMMAACHQGEGGPATPVVPPLQPSPGAATVVDASSLEAPANPTATPETPTTAMGSAPNELPGRGKTIRLGRATWETGWFQAEIYKRLLEELGYTVEGPTTLENEEFYLAAARGTVDMWANGWFPIHTTYLEDERVRGKVGPVGYEVRAGALQGYLMDRKTADAYGITNLGDLKDPEIARLFDHDGDGTADLIGCPKTWGCARVINHHLEGYGLRSTVEHIQTAAVVPTITPTAAVSLTTSITSTTSTTPLTPTATEAISLPTTAVSPTTAITATVTSALTPTAEGAQGVYTELMSRTIEWYERGEPILFYTWTPNWTVGQLKPGRDVVWIEVPFPSLPPEQQEMEDLSTVWGVEGCVSDPCQMGFPPNDIRVVANVAFLEANPAVARLLEQVEIPAEDIAAQNALMFEGENQEEDIRAHADGWLFRHREVATRWLTEARQEN